MIHGMTVTIVVLLMAGGYAVSLLLHPFRSCRGCKGTGRLRGTLFSYAHRQCTSCGGSGRHRRFGTVLISWRRSVWAEKSAANASNRWNRPR
jgi:DnaJ-class molecular chaperone